MIFIDSDFCIGIYYKEETHHKQSIALLQKVNDSLVTSYDVVDEVVTKLNYKVGKSNSIIFLEDIYDGQIKIVFPDTKLIALAKVLYQKQKNTHVSWTDCMNMAIAKDKKIHYILSFDKIYEKNGFKLFK